MAERKSYDEATKAAVMAALLEGQSINYCVKEYKIPRGTVSSWSRNLPRNHTVSSEKRERIGELIIDNVEAELVTMIAMQNVFTDEKWLRKQRASELAVLYGVIKDKNIRVLEAIPNDESERTDL